MTLWSQIRGKINAFNYVFIIFVGLYVISSTHSQCTRLDVIKIILGFYILSAEISMSHCLLNPIRYRFSHRNKFLFHGILQLIGGSFSLLSGLDKVQSTELYITTWDRKVGFYVTFICLASILNGILNLWQPKFMNNAYSLNELKIRQIIFGWISFLMSVATITLDMDGIPAFALVTILVYFMTIIAPVRSFLDRLVNGLWF